MVTKVRNLVEEIPILMWVSMLASYLAPKEASMSRLAEVEAISQAAATNQAVATRAVATRAAATTSSFCKI